MKERYEKGLSLSGGKIKKENPILFKSVIYYWDGWIAAMEAMKLPVRKYRQWTKEQLIQTLELRIRNNQGINFTVLCKEDSGLIFQILKYFGSQKKLYDFFGIKSSRNLSKEEVLEILWKQSKKYGGLSVCKLQEINIYKKILKYFGSRDNALKAMGLSQNKINQIRSLKINQKWSAERVLATIVYLSRYNENLGRGHIIRTDESLYTAARKYFGSWSKAVQKAGLEYFNPQAGKKHIRWSRTKVLEAAEALLNKYGDIKRIPKSERFKIYKPCRQFYGSLMEALTVAQRSMNKSSR